MTTTPSLTRRGVLLTVATFALLGASIATPAHAHDFRAGQLVIDHPYATPSLAGTPNGVAYLRGIHNRGTAPDRLMVVSTPVAERVELHAMTTEGDVMHMREVPAIDLPAGQKVQLRHGQRYHLVLINLRQPLKVGDRFDLSLKFEKAGETTVKAWVQQSRDGGGDGGHRHY